MFTTLQLFTFIPPSNQCALTRTPNDLTFSICIRGSIIAKRLKINAFNYLPPYRSFIPPQLVAL